MPSLLLVVYLVVLVFTAEKSCRRTQTVLYSLGGAVCIVAVAYVLSLIFPPYAAALGDIAGPICVLTGMLIAIKHSRDNRKPVA